MAELADRLRNIRKERNLTQEDVTASTGIPRRRLCTYETSEGYPSVPVLTKLAKFYGVSVDYLLFGTIPDEGNFKDRELFELFQKIDKLDYTRKAMVKEVLDSVLAKEELREMKRAS